MKAALLALACAYAVSSPAAAEGEEGAQPSPMTQARLEGLLRSMAPGAEGPPGALSFRFNGVQVECISDVEHDRMRLVVAITPVSELTPEQVASILEANFHTALDARYATSNGYLYAAYIHPLSPLTEAQVRSAVRQVSNLARAFGRTYSSGELVYGGPGPPI